MFERFDHVSEHALDIAERVIDVICLGSGAAFILFGGYCYVLW